MSEGIAFAEAMRQKVARTLFYGDSNRNPDGSLTIFDPDATWKKKTIHNFVAKPLQVPIFLEGKLVYQLPKLEEIQQYCSDQMDTLWMR